MKRKVSFFLLYLLYQSNADVVDPSEINKPGTFLILGLKIGYQFRQGVIIAPEISIGYINGTTKNTDPFIGLTIGYKKIFSKLNSESDPYLNICGGAITEPFIIYGASIGVQYAMRYGSRPLLFSGKTINTIENTMSIFSGLLSTTDVTMSGTHGNKSIGISQKIALPLPIEWKRK